MERLTVDNPRNNCETLLNYAYAKDGRVYLRYADGEGDVDLCEYIAKNACCEEIDAAAIMDGACVECDNKTAILYTVAVQAAELRARLAHYEDLDEQGRLVVLPCKVWDKVWVIDKTVDKVNGGFEKVICEGEIIKISYNGFTTPEEWIDYRWDSPLVGQTARHDRIDLCLGKTVFLVRTEAEAAIAAREKGGVK